MLLKVLISILFVIGYKVQGEEHFQCRSLLEYDATTRGEITSPFYGKGAYPSNLWCEYKITAPAGLRIKLTFKDLDLEASGMCNHDQLTVYSKEKESTLGKYCGSHIPNPMISTEGEFRLLFRTDFMVSGRGFRIAFESGPSLELCSEGEYQCRNRNCYQNHQKCDGVDDCGDGTDEEKCGKPIEGLSEDCGKTPIEPVTSNDYPDRQVGGVEAVPNSWPWTVSLQYSYTEPNGHFCGGTLISPQWVVTAAHCVKDEDPSSGLKIVIGSHNKFKKSKYEVTRIAEKIISYPDLEYDKLRWYNMNHDVALIKLNAPVAFNDGIQPACLPPRDWDAEIGMHCISCGWGETRGSGFSDSLKQTEVIVQNRDHCGYDPKSEICVMKEKSSPCHGDSGGPLIYKNGEKWFVIGATSGGITTNFITGFCGTKGHKVIFSKISDKVDWIQEIIEKYS